MDRRSINAYGGYFSQTTTFDRRVLDPGVAPELFPGDRSRQKGSLTTSFYGIVLVSQTI